MRGTRYLGGCRMLSPEKPDETNAFNIIARTRRLDKGAWKTAWLMVPLREVGEALGYTP